MRWEGARSVCILFIIPNHVYCSLITIKLILMKPSKQLLMIWFWYLLWGPKLIVWWSDLSPNVPSSSLDKYTSKGRFAPPLMQNDILYPTGFLPPYHLRESCRPWPKNQAVKAITMGPETISVDTESITRSGDLRRRSCPVGLEAHRCSLWAEVSWAWKPWY